MTKTLKDMNKELKIVGMPMPDMPWEDRPEGCKNVMWRYSANPVIPRDLLPNSNSIFNSAIVPFEDGYFDAYYDGLLRLFAFMHMSGKYQIIFPEK